MGTNLPLFTFPRETVELVRLDVRVDDTPTDAYRIAVVPHSHRPDPAAWRAPDTAGDHAGYLTGQLTPGLHVLWVQVDDDPEHPTNPYVWLSIT